MRLDRGMSYLSKETLVDARLYGSWAVYLPRIWARTLRIFGKFEVFGVLGMFGIFGKRRKFRIFGAFGVFRVFRTC